MEYNSLIDQIETEISTLNREVISNTHQYISTKNYIYNTTIEMNLVQAMDFTFGGIITSSLKHNTPEMLAYYDTYNEFAAKFGAYSLYDEEDYNRYIDEHVDEWAEQEKYYQQFNATICKM